MNQLELYESAILQIRKALTGDIHSTSNLLEDIEKLKSRVIELERFVQEWSNRFGFLATKNPKNSFDSIDEVATLLYEARET